MSLLAACWPRGQTSYRLVHSQHFSADQIITTEQDLIVDFVLAATNHDDATLVEQMLMPYRDVMVIGHEGYIDELTHGLLLRRNDLRVLTLKRCNQKVQLSQAAIRCLDKARQMIETVGSQLSGN